MKPNPWLYPGLALLAVGTWIGIQKRSAATVEHRITQLRTAIRKTHERQAADERSHAAAQREAKKIDWKAMASQVSGGDLLIVPNYSALSRMQRLLMKMTPEELISQLDAIDMLDLPEESRITILGLVLNRLSETHPEYVLQRYQNSIKGTTQTQWPLIMALRHWAQKDLQSAVRWLDQQIDSGTFESKALSGKSASRIHFEAIIIGQLALSDPQTAIARAMRISPDERQSLYQFGVFGIHTTKEPASTSRDANYLQVVRAILSPEQASAVLASQALGFLGNGNYDRVDQFIANTHATEADKKEIARNIINSRVRPGMLHSVSRESLDEARDWAARHVPESMNQLTGEALASTIWGNQGFEKASTIALDYQQSTGSDEVLAAFLDSEFVKYNPLAKEKARELISRIKDPAIRERIGNQKVYQNP
ncbi:MAG: hypothetical protein QM627_10785 [Luteolibacter sp.]